MVKTRDEDKVTEAAAETVENSDVSAGDAFGATQDPSPALQADAVRQAEAEVNGDKPKMEGATIQSKSGTVTFVPSKGGYSA